MSVHTKRMFTKDIQHCPLIICDCPNASCKAIVFHSLLMAMTRASVSQNPKVDYWYQNYFGDLLNIQSHGTCPTSSKPESLGLSARSLYFYQYPMMPMQTKVWILLSIQGDLSSLGKELET